MPVRSLIAVLLLLNYLLVVGVGCVNRPGDPRERLLVQIVGNQPDGHAYQECRYLRMDGLEMFLAEALASRYEMATQTPVHHLFFVVNGVDAHYLPTIGWPRFASVNSITRFIIRYKPPVSAGMRRTLYAPPWLG